MFTYQECIESFKYLSKAAGYEGLTHCQRLDQCSRELGFESYHRFRNSLHSLPTDRFGIISLTLVRKYCASVTPRLSTDYYEFYSIKRQSGGVSAAFYSQWIGWDRSGREVREPRAMNGKIRVDYLRESRPDLPVYVLENDKQLLAWLFNWHGIALIPEKLARAMFREKFDRDRLVCRDVDMGLVRACRQNFSRNIAT